MALAPDLPEVMVARARLFYAQKKYEESEQMARRAIERKHDCDGSWNILGRALLSFGNYGSWRKACGAGGRSERRRLQHVYTIRVVHGTVGPKERSGESCASA